MILTITFSKEWLEYKQLESYNSKPSPERGAKDTRGMTNLSKSIIYWQRYGKKRKDN